MFSTLNAYGSGEVRLQKVDSPSFGTFRAVAKRL